MKKTALILIQLLFLFSLISQAQTGNNFKSKNKKPSGMVTSGFTVKTINRSNTLKSTSQNDSLGNVPMPNALSLSRPDSSNVQNIFYQNGQPVFFEQSKSQLKSTQQLSARQQFVDFHRQAQVITKLDDPKRELIITDSVTDALGITHIKAQQLYKGIKVYGAESRLHINATKNIFTGHIYLVDKEINTKPTLSNSEAINIVEQDLSNSTDIQKLSQKVRNLLKYEGPEANLLIMQNTLAYKISIRPDFYHEWIYFVDAENGRIIKKFNNTQSQGPTTAEALDLSNTLQTINTYLDGTEYGLINASESMYNASTGEGMIVTFDGNYTSSADLDYSLITSTDNTWDNPIAVSAHYHTTLTYKYLENTFGRSSINDQGGNIISIINITNEDGTSMENAFWNGAAAFYGNGGNKFYPLAGALDVVAHELGHGVISNTANLQYYGQSGAINETYADIFGAMVDRDDWLIGEDAVKTTYYPSGALRNMADPHNTGSQFDSYWQPEHTSEMYRGEYDNGGVHTNSGIGNYAYYLYATAVGKGTAEQVFYRALNHYLTSKTQFIDFRIAVVQSARDLFGDNSNEVTEAQKAFEAVGIYQEDPVNYEQDYPVNPGQEYLMICDVNPDDPNKIYRASTTGDSFWALTTTDLISKPSITDDGSSALFVANDNKIKSLSTNPNALNEFYLSDEAAFDNVAISKDGRRLAAVSTEVDTAIYVYDFDLQEWAKFHLYNPTTDHSGAQGGGILYADAIEFDHTGEYILYDAYNSLNSSTGEDIAYWDIGYIKVWDNEDQYFGDGTVNKLFGSLPKDANVGNPTFSKNSPHIIAFDYFDTSTQEYAILGINLLTGDAGLIANNTTLGFPSFSKNDDKIAFTAESSTGEEVVASINLTPEKISSSDNASTIIVDANWPVYYAEGSRSLLLPPVANFTVDIKTGELPLTVNFTDLSLNDPYLWNWEFEGSTLSTSTEQNPSITYNTPGIYKVTLNVTNDGGSDGITKTSYISVSGNTSINEGLSEVLSFYPNPTEGNLIIESKKPFKIRIFSLSGKEVITSENKNFINLEILTNGIYLIQFEIDGRIFVDKLLKK